MQEKSALINQIDDLLSSVKNKKISLKEKSSLAIELGELIIEYASLFHSNDEKIKISNFTDFLKVSINKTFLSSLIDTTFRSKDVVKTSEHISSVISNYGLPDISSLALKIKLVLTKFFIKSFPYLFVPIVQKCLKKEISENVVIIESSSKSFFEKKYSFSLISNFSYGKNSLKNSIYEYINLISRSNPNILNVNIKDLFFNFDSYSYKTIYNEVLNSFKTVLLAAEKKSDSQSKKIIILNIDLCKNFDLAIAVLKKSLLEKISSNVEIGICLPAYYPKSFDSLKDLLDLSKKRSSDGLDKIHIVISKGKNLTEEKVFSAKNSTAFLLYNSKAKTDGNFKKMLLLALDRENKDSANIYLSTLNAFDIAFSLITIYEN